MYSVQHAVMINMSNVPDEEKVIENERVVLSN